MSFLKFKSKYDNVRKRTSLYHISLEGNLDVHHFTPRIPSRCLDTEDKTTPRICVAETINDCISACPDGYVFFTEKTVLGAAYLYVYEIDILKIGFNNIKFWQELSSLVPDAHKTKEIWVLKEFDAAPKIYRFENMEYEIEPKKGHRYRDVVYGRDNMDYIMQNNTNIINFDERDSNSYNISYFGDDKTIELWDMIAYSHEEYRKDVLNQLLHYS